MGKDLPLAVSLHVQASFVSANRAGFAVVNAGYKSLATEVGMPIVVNPQLLDPVFKLMGTSMAASNKIQRARR